MEGFRVVNDRKSDGIEVKLWWKDSVPPQFQITVDDLKLHHYYEPILATLETYQDVFTHPMAHLADLAIKTSQEQESGRGRE